MTDTAEIIIRPEAGSWGGMLRSRGELNAESRRFREQMGLPVDRPVILTGHQAQVWHPGILAKLLAARAAAGREWVGGAGGATVAWVVVDQDENDPWGLRYPVRRADGLLEARTWRIDGEMRGGDAHVPTASRPPARAVTMPALAMGEAFAAAGVEEGLRRIAESLSAREGEASAARQMALGTMHLLHELCPVDHVVFATGMAKTELFARVVERLKSDPVTAVRAYNAAVRGHPGARIAELRLVEAGLVEAGGSEDVELPLWHVPRGKGGVGAMRRRVTAGMLMDGKIGIDELAPRALLMTGLLRWAGCDLFIHGTGGAGDDGASGYDAITEEWMLAWLGAALAPMAMVTATVRLRIASQGQPITPEQIAQARWLAHAARHRPGLLHDGEGEAAREEVVATLRRLRWKKDAASRRVKLESYRTLHRTLDRVRAAHGPELAMLESQAATAAGRRTEAEILADRTWAFPLYEPEQMMGLREEIGKRF